jgi:hypothetical protein
MMVCSMSLLSSMWFQQIHNFKKWKALFATESCVRHTIQSGTMIRLQRDCRNFRLIKLDMINANKVQSDCWCDDPSARLTMVRIKKTVAKLESDIIDEIKQKIGKDISDLIALKSEEFLENQKINEEKNLREEKLAVEQRKYDEQLKHNHNEIHMNNLNFMNYPIPHVDYSHTYRPNYPQAAYPVKWVRFKEFSRI